MNVTYRLYRRGNGKFYAQHNETGRQISLGTSDENTAKLLLQGHNEGSQDAQVSREVGLAYLSCTDPEAKKRTWAWVFVEVLKTKSKDTDNYRRWSVAIRDKAFNSIRTMPLIDTRSDHFLKVLHEGKVSTNVFLRRIHNFAIDMVWLARPVIVKRQWPKVKRRKKRAVTWEKQKLIRSGGKTLSVMIFSSCCGIRLPKVHDPPHCAGGNLGQITAPVHQSKSKKSSAGKIGPVDGDPALHLVRTTTGGRAGKIETDCVCAEGPNFPQFLETWLSSQKLWIQRTARPVTAGIHNRMPGRINIFPTPHHSWPSKN